MIAVLPLLLYPALILGGAAIGRQSKQITRKVVVIGAEHLPNGEDGLPQLLNRRKFQPAYFKDPEDVSKLRVITDVDARIDADSAPEEVQALLQRSNDVRQLANARLRLEAKRKRLERQTREAKDKLQRTELTKQIDALDPEINELNDKISSLMGQAKVQILIVVPPDYAKNIAETNRQLADRNDNTAKPKPHAGMIVFKNAADEKSHLAYRLVRDVLKNWQTKMSKGRWDKAGLPSHVADPAQLSYLEVAEKSQLSAAFWSKIFPVILVIMALTGAFYPAVDLAAGEKERGTMETLLISPASRVDLVGGKFLTIMLFSICTALLNLLSMGLTMGFIGSGSSQFSGLTAPSMAAVGWVIVLLIPLSAMFSALSLALATFAKSSKEGQYYLTPLLIVSMGLTLFSLSPSAKIDPFYSVIPIAGPSLLLKELLSSNGFSNALLYAFPVLLSSIAYSVLALWWAIEQFSGEDILFREAERFSPKLWLRNLLRNKKPTPTFSEAVFCLVTMLSLMFGLMLFAKSGLLRIQGGPTTLLWLLMGQQLVVIALPAIIMALLLTTSFRKTLRLQLPKLRYLLMACLLPFVLHPLSIEMGAALSEWFFPPLPEQVTSQFGAMHSPDIPTWLILLAFAAAPAICEEIAFRGFLLSGFNEKNRYWLAIALSSVAFGLIHMIPQQVFNAALLGLVIGLLAIRSKSLLPCVVFHFIYNSLGVANSQIGAKSNEYVLYDSTRVFFALEQGALRFEWPLLAICIGIASAVIYSLVRETSSNSSNKAGYEAIDHKSPAASVARHS